MRPSLHDKSAAPLCKATARLAHAFRNRGPQIVVANAENSVHYVDMILCVANVLSSVQLEEINSAFGTASFRETLNLDCQTYAPASKIVRAAILENETIQAAALPHTLGALTFGRTDPGMVGGGPETDSGVLGSPRIRADLAFTLFLSDPSHYEGGELLLVGHDGDEEFKLPAGALVLHPATSMHRIRTVRSGRREVCFGWIQSLVRDPRVREMLFDLSRLKRYLFREQGNSEMFDLVAKTQSNLLRMHAEV